MAAKSSDWRPGPTVCRCCLGEGCYKDISTEYFWMGKREVYAEMLAETLDLEIAFSLNKGPNSNSRLICEACIARLRDASEFKKQVQDCEKTFMQHLDFEKVPEADEDAGEISDTQEKEVKLERVKQELSDDDDDDNYIPPDSDDDDMDDEPLTKLATKVPKKESFDILPDYEEKPTIILKRKSTLKAKATPAKKSKVTVKKSETASASKTKPEKKKKDGFASANIIAKRNAELIVKYSTAYPFRIPEHEMVCVFCCESYSTASDYRAHIADEHKSFKLRMAFVHCSEGYLKVDITDLRCRICHEHHESLESIASHLFLDHDVSIDFGCALGLQPFRFPEDRFVCCICNKKAMNMRELSRHTQTHFLLFTCELCGKSYATNSSLQKHIRDHDTQGTFVCSKCKSAFLTSEERRQHVDESPKCWKYLCYICGLRIKSNRLKAEHLAEIHQIEPEPVICRDCGQQCANRKVFHRHFKIAHSGDALTCSFCGQKFPNKREHSDHLVKHTQERAFECTVCCKGFATKKSLTQHMWNHKEEKRFECTICSKKFNQRVSWRTHMKNHHPELVDSDTGKTNVKFLMSMIDKAE